MGKLKNKNVWGSSGEHSLEAQRTDLWRLDLGEAVSGLSKLASDEVRSRSERDGTEFGEEILATRFPGQLTDSWYYAKSVTFPDIKVNSEQFRQHSSPIFFPGWDNPPTEFSVVFIHDSNDRTGQSSIVGLLKAWLRAVRAGRKGGAPLNDDFSASFAFNVVATLLSGYRPPDQNDTSEGALAAALEGPISESGGYIFRKTWLAGYKLGDISYENSQVMTVTATFNCALVSEKNG